MRRRGPGSARVASMPSTPGIRMSITTTSGRSRRTSGATAAPSPASPTTSNSGSRIARSPVRISGSSSTSRTFTAAARPSAARRPPRCRPTSGPRRIATRSSIPGSPRPPPGRAEPTGLVSSSSSRSARTAIVTDGSPAPWRAAFVNPSWMIRYASRDTAPGTRCRSPLTSMPRSPRSGAGADGSSRSSPSTWSRSRWPSRAEAAMWRSASRANAGSLSSTRSAAAAWIETTPSA